MAGEKNCDIFIYNRISLNIKKKQNNLLHFSLVESGKCYIKQKNKEEEDQTLDNITMARV